jgi:hypothetical protein
MLVTSASRITSLMAAQVDFLSKLSGERLPRRLPQLLHSKRRVLFIVDGVSEMEEDSRAAVLEALAGPGGAFVVTARTLGPLDGVPASWVSPLPIEARGLSSFVDEYLRRRKKRELFDKYAYIAACGRITALSGTSGLTPLLATMYIDELVFISEKSRNDAPVDVPDLMLRYLDRLNAEAKSPRPPKDVRRDAKATALACIEGEYRPRSIAVEHALKALSLPGESSNELARQRLDHLARRMRVLRLDETGARVSFDLDPIAEYLAALALIEQQRDDGLWDRTLAELAARRASPTQIDGFLRALLDRCQHETGNQLEDITKQVAEWVGVDPASIRSAEHRKIRDSILSLTVKVVLIVGRFSTERKLILEALWDSLHQLGYRPVLFDFDPPAGRTLTEMIVTLAYLSHFIVADLSDPQSVPQELDAIIPRLAMPIQPILQDGAARTLATDQGLPAEHGSVGNPGPDVKPPYPLFPDFWKRQFWVLPLLYYSDKDDLLRRLETGVIGPSEEMLKRIELATKVGVAKVGA